MGMSDREMSAWTVALRLEAPFSTKALSAYSGIPISTCRTWLQGWIDRGLVERVGVATKIKFRVIAEPAAVRPCDRAQTPERNLWTAMRNVQSFAVRDLAAHASTDTLQVSVAEAQKFAQCLLQAGYLRVVRKAQPPHVHAVYKLIRNTGPEAPRERRIAALWDPNEARWTYLPEAPQ